MRHFFTLFFLTSIVVNAQTVTTLAGSTPGFADGPVASALFAGPNGVAMDHSNGNLIITDWGSHTIRGIDLTNMTVNTIAGSTMGYTDGPNLTAQFREPTNACTDAQGNIYVADFQNNLARRISGGNVSTFPANNFFSPSSVVMNCASGDLYLVGYNEHKIFKIDPSGNVSVLAGSGTYGFADGTGASAQFANPYGICMDLQGNLIIADRANHRIRKITPSGVVTTIAGTGTAGYLDGPALGAQFNTPCGVAADIAGNIYIADTQNNMIRKISASGNVSTIAGSVSGFADGPGTLAQFNFPACVTIDQFGNVYVADIFNYRIRKITFSDFSGVGSVPGVPCSLTDLVTESTMNQVKLFPNPTQGKLHLKLDQKLSYPQYIIISDVLGNTIKEIKDYDTYDHELDLDDLANGVYVVKINYTERVLIQKIIKN